MFVIQACEEIPFVNPCFLYDILKKDAVSDDGEAYLLESREGDDKMARYSIIGFDPAFKFAVKDNFLTTKSYDAVIDEAMDNVVAEDINPLSLIKAFLNELKIERAQKRDRFIGGFVGYFSYDFIRYLQDLDESTLDTLGQPDCEFLLTNKNVIVDHSAKKAFFISNEFSDTPNKGMDSDATCVDVAKLLKEAEVPDNQAPISIAGDFRSNMEKADYERSVRVAKEYIRAGDIFQVVLSQRLEADFAPEGHFQFYKILSEVNPSPYMYLLDFGERKIVGASPEMLVRVAGLPQAGKGSRKVESCPIAGTRRRGINEEEDKRLEVEMLNDEKERAEHLMLVDLSRNDIGKVSEFGTVKATRFMYPEKYSHVQHIVTDVVGELRTDKDEFDALEATFPAGTVSGAPKVRAMEIIEELEPTRRGVYAGCVGYFSFNRSMDTAITIRTAVFEHGKVYIQAGAGIVADSDPEREYKETLSKCAASLACISGGARKK
jgi:anthranilate synthase component 1